MNSPDFEAVKTLDPKAVFSVAEVAQLLGMTYNGALNRIQRGAIVSGKSGSRYFVLGSEIQKQIQLPKKEIDV